MTHSTHHDEDRKRHQETHPGIHPVQIDPLLQDKTPATWKKKASYIVGFLLAVIVADRIVGLGLEQIALRSQYKYSTLYRGGIDAEVIIVGNSRGLHSLYAPEFEEKAGVSAFNLSSNALGMDACAALIGDCLEKPRKPRIVLLEISSLYVKPGEAHVTFQPFFGRSERLSAQYRELLPKRYWACKLFHSFRYNGTTIEKCVLYFRKSDQRQISSEDRVIPAEMLANRQVDVPGEPEKSQVEYLEQILEDCRKANVKLVPFIAPYIPGIFGDDDIKGRYHKDLADLMDQMPEILDYSQRITDEKAFSDRVHTNVRGARLLLDMMVADGVFKDEAEK